MRAPLWFAALVPPLLLVSGCGGGGGGASGETPTGVPTGAPAAPTAPVLRWDPAEHSVDAVEREWWQTERWQEDLKVLLKDQDKAGRQFGERLDKTPEPRKTELVGELLEYWERAGHPDLAVLLKRYPVQLARVLAELMSTRPEAALRSADYFLFHGLKPVPEAWKVVPLRSAVTRLCKRTGFDVTDIQTGRTRMWALRVAGNARLKEAVGAIRDAAGYGKDPSGNRLAADSYGPAAAMAVEIMRRERARRPRRPRKSRRTHRRRRRPR